MLKLLKKTAALLAVSLMLFTSIGASMAQVVELDQFLLQQDRQQLQSLVDRQDVQEQLQAYGLNPEQVQERIAQMTEDELQTLQQHLGDLPAGEYAGQVISLAFALFIIFLITDMIGATNVFPFVKSLN